MLLHRALGSLERRVAPGVMVASVAAWAALLALDRGGRSGICGSSARAAWIQLERGDGFADGAGTLLGSLVWSWCLMLAAMMAPTLCEPLDHVWTRTFRRRRWRSVILFAAGYAAVWLAAGALLLAMWAGLSRVLESGERQWFGAGLALLWQFTPIRQIGLNRCHAVDRLCAWGWRADRDSTLFGARLGAWCVASCWALMGWLWMIDRYQLAAMAIASVFLFLERQRPGRPVRWPWPVSRLTPVRRGC